MSHLVLDTKDKINILGVCVHTAPLDTLIDFIKRSCLNGDKVIVAYVNAYTINLAYRLTWFRDFLNNCDLVFCDGFGVKWAAKFLHKKPLDRHTPPDWLPLLAQEFAQQNLTMYFLGAKPGIAEKAAAVLTVRIPGLKVVGCQHGYFDKSPQSQEQKTIIQDINRLHPNLLVVGFGMPAQEQWIQENWADIHANVALPAGAMFDYLAGELTRAPRWMTDHGLEWLGRLIIEPQRLWKRYLVGNTLFIGRVLMQKLGLLKLDRL